MTHLKTNRKRLYAVTVFAVFFCSAIFSSSSSAGEYVLEQQLVDPNAPADVCPNIPGTQATIPSGMQLDGGGNCYTPTPAPTPTPSPVTTDLCTNINGTQTALPDGYYRTTTGRCYVQPSAPAEPVDVCSNLQEVQTTVPSDYYLNENNECITILAPADECPNIGGPQMTIPDGMVRENEICYTPTSTSTDGTGSVVTGNDPASSSGIQRVPAFLRPAVMSIMSIIPEGAKQWLRSLPENTAQVVPYYIFLIVGILALIPILQSIREALFARQIALILQRERTIAEEKDSFVALASHYLRTPLTLMNGGLDTVISMNELTVEQITPLKLEVASLDSKIGSILQDIETNTALKNISAPSESTPNRPVWRSGWFWGPIIGSLLLVLIANFLLVIVGEKEIGVTHTFFHFLVAAISFIILYLGVRNLHLQRKLRAQKQQLMNHEMAIDEARNAFISETTLTLQDALEQINQQRVLLGNAPSAIYFDEGYARIEAILQKFLLVGQIQAGTERDTEAINVNEAIENLLVSFGAAISAKRLTVTNATSPVFIRQNRMLFNFVLSSIIDNAIKFNQEGGTIEINLDQDSKMLVVKIADNGIGIDEEKLGQLFKPFSRTTSAVEFNYEGLGFSLFLDKIIMDYTGGAIDIQSTENQGTQLLVATPIASSD